MDDDDVPVVVMRAQRAPSSSQKPAASSNSGELALRPLSTGSVISRAHSVITTEDEAAFWSIEDDAISIHSSASHLPENIGMTSGGKCLALK